MKFIIISKKKYEEIKKNRICYSGNIISKYKKNKLIKVYKTYVPKKIGTIGIKSTLNTKLNCFSFPTKLVYIIGG